MMAGNFQQMGNAGGNPMMMQQQAQGPNSQSLQMLLLQQIRAHSQPAVGWQASVAEQERLSYTFQLVTQLRLANPASQDLTKICRAGLDFEKQSYDSAHDKDTYVKLINGKLGQLTSARQMSSQQMAQQQQMGMANQAGAMGQPFQQGMQQLQNMQHLQQQMQPSPMQGQQQPQQIPMGMGNNIMGQNIPPNAQFQMNMQQQQQQQAQMQGQPGGQARPQAPLTPQEQQIIVQIAKQMIGAASEQDKQNIRARAQATMTPEQWERTQASHIDPIHQFYQQQAIKRYRMQKAAQMQAQRQSGQGMPMGMNRPQGAIPMQQQRSGNPNPMVPQPQQGQQHGIPGNPDFAFLDPQQQNQNPQDGNQLGMQPSLSQQGNTTPQNMAGLPVQAITPNQQRMAQNPQMAARQQQFNAQQQAQAQAQAQEKARRAQMAALQGQPGGLGGMPPNQSPAMNTLNAPLAGTPQQNTGQGPAVSQPGPSQFGQPIDPRFVGMNQRPGVNGQMPFPNGMNAEQRQKLSQLPPEKLNEMIAKWNQQRAMQEQANGLAGGMPGGGQMMQHPGGPQPQPGQQGMANPMTQFMPNGGQPMQRPPSQMPPGMTPQQQALLRQQMQQRQMPQAGAPQPQGPGGEQPGALDNLDFPPGIHTIIPRQLIPQGITKWGQLKQWIVANGANGGLDVGGIMEKATQLQRTQMQQLLRQRQLQQQNQQRAAAGLPPLPPQQPGQPGQQGVTPQMTQQLAHLQQMQGPVTAQDVENARTHGSGRWGSLTDDQIRQNLMIQRRNQHIQFLQRTQQQQQMQQQNQQFNQQQMGQMSGMPQMPGQNMPNGMQRPVGAPQQPVMPPQGMKRPQPNQPGAPPKQLTALPMEAKQTPQQRAAKPTQPTSSPAQPQNSKKRASSDDVVEVPNPNAQVNRPQMPPGQGGMQKPPNFVMPTPEQLAAMPPEKKQRYMQFMMQQRQRQMAALGPQPTQADMQEFSRIRTDESAKWKPSPPVQMTPEERTLALQGLGPQASRINQVFNIAPKWFAMKKDEQRLRAFFRAHLSMNDQFEDGAKMQRPKAALSMKAADISNAMAIANSIVQDVAAKHPEMMKARQAQAGQQQQPNAAGSSQQGQQQQAPGTAPLNAANLQQQQQALSQAQKEQNKQIQRASVGGNNKAPPAPTTQHAPNMASGGPQGQKSQSAAQHASPANQAQFAVNSPHGVPAMYGPSKIDQGQLRLPPNKRKKTDGGMTSAGNTPVQQPKPAPDRQQSQPMMKQESQQEHKATPNSQQEMPQQQQQPRQQGFVCTDRDCEGQVPPFATEEALKEHVYAVHQAPTEHPTDFMMSVMGDFLGLDDNQKSAAEGLEVKQDANVKTSPSQKPKEAKKEQADPWAASGVNPQELMAIFKPFETGASGAISNVDAYRSISPNDTPESMQSSKESDAMNSDITEGTALDINMQFSDDKDWAPFGESDMDGFVISEEVKPVDRDPRPVGQRGDNEMVYNELPSEQPEDMAGWDDMVQWEEADKPFSFDSALFEMDDGSSMF